MTKRQRTLVVLSFVSVFILFAFLALSILDVADLDTEVVVWFGVGSGFIIMLMALDFILGEKKKWHTKILKKLQKNY